MLASSVIRQALVPMAAFYLIFMIGLGLGLIGTRGSSRTSRATDPRQGWPALVRHTAATIAGGYVLLVAVDVAYYYGIARVGGHFLSSAVTGPALLIGLAVPVFAAASWLLERRRRRSRDRGVATARDTGREHRRVDSADG